ncbi:MAG: hypothetical protein AB8G86_06215, partial [Saprospiraceae bacterium]
MNAQKVVKIKSDSSSVVEPLTTCNGEVTSTSSVRFMDDGGNDGNYADSYARLDTATFCPANAESVVKIVFTDFDLAAGDTLFAFQGDKKALDAAAAAAFAAARAAIAANPSVTTTKSVLLSLLGGSPANTMTVDSIGIPKGTSVAALTALAATTPVDSAAVVAAMKAGYLPKGLDLSKSGVLGASIAVLQALVDATKASLASLAISQLDGVRGASVDTGSGSGAASGAGLGTTGLASARSVSDAFGGWINASGIPAINATGCLTFVFSTNGDRAKGTGWDAWVDCGASGLTLSGAGVPKDVQLVGGALAVLDITAPFGVIGKDTLGGADTLIQVLVKDASGKVISTDTLNSGQSLSAAKGARSYPVGCYTVTFTLVSNPAIKTAPAPFCVTSPSLACNGEVNTVFGAACQLSISPDMVLENPVDEGGGLTYQINFKLDKKVVATGTIANPPVISQDSLVAAGGKACKGALTVEIIRYIASGTDTVETVTCSSTLKYTDNTAPIFGARMARLDTLIQADTVGVAKLFNAPTATDNCGSLTMESSVKEVRNAAGNIITDLSDICVYPIKVVIKHTAEDECENETTSTTVDTVVIFRPFGSAFTVPGIDSLECNASDPGYIASGAPKLQTGRIKNGDTTYTGTIAVDTLDYTAGYILRYRDEVIDEGDCGAKVFRTWSYVDWCD